MGKIFVKIKDRHVIIHDTRGGDMVWLNDQRQRSGGVSDRRQAKQWSTTPHHITFCWQTRLAWDRRNPPSNAPHYRHCSKIASGTLSMKLHWQNTFITCCKPIGAVSLCSEFAISYRIARDDITHRKVTECMMIYCCFPKNLNISVIEE